MRRGKQLFVEAASKLSIRDRYLKGLMANVAHRCTNPKDKRFKSYGGRGIKCLFTHDELIELYERDRPDTMIRPSIDRVDNDGDYTLDNCRFLEMRDNAARAKRHEYPCAECSAMALLTKVNGKGLCPACTRKARIAAIDYPGYVSFAIDEATKRGCTVESLLYGKRDYYASRTRIVINGELVRVHYAALGTSTGSKQLYWRFSATDKDIRVHVLVARYRKALRCWVLDDRTYLDRRTIYIPVRPTDSENQFTQFENAWHLLEQQRLDQEAADLATKIDPYRPSHPRPPAALEA